MTATALAPSTLEVNETHAYLYSTRQAGDALAWYCVGLERAQAAGAPVTVTVGELLHVTYPETGEQLAQAAYERLIAKGIPKTAMRYRGEAQ